MNSNGLLKKHWFLVTSHACVDAFLFLFAHILGVTLRFRQDDWATVLEGHFGGIITGAILVPICAYIVGLYAPSTSAHGYFRRGLTTAGCVALGLFCSLPWSFFTLTDLLGRGVTVLSGVIALVLIAMHHAALLHRLQTSKERIAYLVGSDLEEAETRVFDSIGLSHLKLKGLITYDGYKAQSEGVLGDIQDIQEIVRRERIRRVLCTDRAFNDDHLTRIFCELRFSGVIVMPLVTLCEEVDRCIPLELVTPGWLLHASAEPHQLYIEKLKRFFDVIVSLLGILLSFPLMLLSMALIKLTSPGPIFYRQLRAGRFGRPFLMIKLRTMRTDAETSGAMWSTGESDPRVTGIGRFLRRYRLDEVPQLFNVLRGEMSFVGPRPERPEIIEKLAQEIPYFLERSLVHPGITGWAQVNYPYGSSVEDARRKLEYDLYYLKNMSIPLDIFILLDTIRIVLTGGVADDAKRRSNRQVAMQEWERIRTSQVVTVEAHASRS